MENVFVMVTSKTCGHCVTFKQQHLNKLLTNLSGNGINIINISLPDRDIKGLETKKNDIIVHVGPPDAEIEKKNSSKIVIYYLQGGNIGINLKIIKLIKGYPQFFLFPKDSWITQNGPLTGLMFNGTINPDGTSSLNQTGQPANAETLTKWIKDNNPPAQNVPLPGYLRPSNPAYNSGSNLTPGNKFKIKITSFDY